MTQPRIEAPSLKPAEVKTETIAKVDCPACGSAGQFTVSHILADQAKGTAWKDGYTWLCTACHHEIDFKFGEDGGLLCGPNGRRSDYDFVVLEITAETLKRTGRVFLIDDGLRSMPDGSSRFSVLSTDPHPTTSDPRDHDYFFTEHSCNINTLRHLEEIIVVDGDEVHNDPHSLFEVVGAVPWHKYKTANGHLDFDSGKTVVRLDGGASWHPKTDLRGFLEDAGVLPRVMSTAERGAWIEENIPRLTAGEVIRLGDLQARKEAKPGRPIYTLEKGRDERWLACDPSPGALLDEMLLHYHNPRTDPEMR